MVRTVYLLCLALCLLSCSKSKKEAEKVVETQVKTIKTVDFEGLTPYLTAKDDKTYVVNFWATWCAPCIKELPYFQELDSVYADDQLELTLISLDFPDQVDSKLIPFVEKHQIKEKVVLLDAPNENEWIPKIDSTWSGAIPATIIFNKEKRAFFEQSFTKEALFEEVEKFTNNTKI